MGEKHKKQFSFYISQCQFSFFIFFRMFVPLFFFADSSKPCRLVAFPYYCPMPGCCRLNRKSIGSRPPFGPMSGSCCRWAGAYTIYIYIYWYLWTYGCICVCVHIHIYEILKGSSCATFWSRLVKAISFQTCLKRVKFSLFMCAACLDGCDVKPLLKTTQRAVTNMHFLLVSLSDWPFAVDEYSVTRQQDSCTRFAGAQRSWLSKLLDIAW